jgi:hypothetical protein
VSRGEESILIIFNTFTIIHYSLFTIHSGQQHCYITIVFLTCGFSEVWIEGGEGVVVVEISGVE